MKKIVILGGGFAGQMAMRRLRRVRGAAAITLVDHHSFSDFLPLLPDVIGGRVSASAVRQPLAGFARKCGCELVTGEVNAIDSARAIVTLRDGHELPYDALIIASGSETNFYADAEAPRWSLKLDNADDALMVRTILADARIRRVVVVGGGYTGVEVAANVRRFALRNRKDALPVTILERGNAILNALPGWMQTFAAGRLRKLDVECVTGMAIGRIAERQLSLKNGRVFEDAAIIWCAGVQTAPYVRRLPFEQTPQGRLIVDAHLRVAQNVYVAGDTAAWLVDGKPLRMSVQFARLQGDCAGYNAACAVDDRPLLPFKPLDPGYVIPITGGGGCGSIFGLNLKGWLPMMLHYAMCLYRLPAFRQQRRMLADMIR